jgi:hypothetical protein
MITCQECGMVTKSAGEYHPYAACLLFRACGNGNEVRAHLAAVQAERATAEQSAPVVATHGAFHTSVIVKLLLDEAFHTLRPNRPEDCPEEPHMRVALGKSTGRL